MSETEISNSCELEKEWLKWSGINTMRTALPEGITVGKTGLYKRFTPGDPYKAVIFVMRCELIGLKGDIKSGMDLVKFTREANAPDGLELVDSALYCLDKDTISQAANSK